MPDKKYPYNSEIGTLIFNKPEEEFEEKITKLLHTANINSAIGVLLARQTCLINDVRMIREKLGISAKEEN